MKRGRNEDDDGLGIPWEKLADGIPHRLKRKRDFPDIDPKVVRQAAKDAARRMGKAVQALPDTMGGRNKFVWVQFADQELTVGDPCRCGGRRILRFHQYFGRCAACQALILFTSGDTKDDDEPTDKIAYGFDKIDAYGWGDAGNGSPPTSAG